MRIFFFYYFFFKEYFFKGAYFAFFAERVEVRRRPPHDSGGLHGHFVRRGIHPHQGVARELDATQPVKQKPTHQNNTMTWCTGHSVSLNTPRELGVLDVEVRRMENVI